MLPWHTHWRKLSLVSKFTVAGVAVSVVASVVSGAVWLGEKVWSHIASTEPEYELSYDLVSATSLTRSQLQDGLNEVGASYRSKLDDPILDNYYVYRIRLANVGKAIRDPLNYSVTLDADHSKFIDFQFKVRKPINKVLQVTSTLPDLEWEMPERPADLILSWTDPNKSEVVAGYNIYGSYLADRGFGRLNPALWLRNTITMRPPNSPRYYSITTVNTSGLESPRPAALRYPDVLAFVPSFKHVYWVKSEAEIAEASGTRQHPFASVYAVLEHDPKARRVILDRKLLLGTKKLPDGLDVLREEELAFLKGQLTLTTSGFDANAEIELILVAKGLSQFAPSISFRIDGAPEVQLSERRSILQTKSTPRVDTSPHDARARLTPSKITTRIGDDAISLEFPSVVGSEGVTVRIFRRELGSLSEFQYSDEAIVGQEVHDGPLVKRELLCTPNIDLKTAETSSGWWAKRPLDLPRPPPRDARLPGPPSSLSISARSSPRTLAGAYFIDTDVVRGVVYQYTAFVEDFAKNEASYPVILNAMLDAGEAMYCETQSKQ